MEPLDRLRKGLSVESQPVMRAEQGLVVPRLVEKSDGSYFVRHFYQQHSTWQIGADGVLFLNGRGIRAGGLFSTDLFMDLWTRGMVYIGKRGRVSLGGFPAGPSSRDEPALSERAGTVYRALHRSKLEDAYSLLLPEIRAARDLRQFGARLIAAGCSQLTHWRILSFHSFPVQDEAPSDRTRIGLLMVNLGMQDKSGADVLLAGQREYWCLIGGVWYWVWWGWQRETTART